MDLMRALLRRWYVVLIVMGAALALAFLSTRADAMYHARTEVIFLAPASARYPNELVTSSESLILTAGAVVERINGATEQLKFGASSVNPIGSPGIVEDTWIRLLDTGNQWVPAFEHQVIVVDATGTTPERAEARIADAADLISSTLQELESAHGVDPLNVINLRLSPEAPVVTKVDGSSARSAGMTLFLGVLATIATVVILEVRRPRGELQSEDEAPPRRRRARRHQATPPPL